MSIPGARKHSGSALAKVTVREKRTGRAVLGGGIQVFSAVLLIAAFLSIQALIGGTRLLFALPSYGMLSLVGVVCILILLIARPAPDQFCLWSAVVFAGYVL